MEIAVLTESWFFYIDDMGLRGHDSKLFKRRFRLDVRKFVFSNRVIDSWNSLPSQRVNCNSDTFKKYISIALESETDVPVPTYAVIV